MTLRSHVLVFLLFLGLGTAHLAAQEIRPDTSGHATLLHQRPAQTGADLEQAMAQLAAGNLDEAEELFKAALRSSPDDPRIYNGLGMIYYRRGRSRFYPLEALKKLLKADNSSKAIRNFRKALELDADFDEARYNLGLAHLARNKEDGYLQAREEFAHLAEKDSTYRDVIYRLGEAEFGLGDLQKAEGHFLRALSLHAEDHRAEVSLAQIYLERGDIERASEVYFDGIAKLRDPDMLEELYDEIRDLCTKEEKEQYESLPLDRKGLFFRRFWSKRDPTPTTIANERFAEHFRRVQYAKVTYGIPFPPYYDDRGRIYVKYGPPDAVHRGTMYSGSVKDNESWSYESIQKGLIFDFVNNGGIYREVGDLTEAAPAGASYQTQLAIAGQLYGERTELGGTYSRMGMNFDQGRLMELSSLKVQAQREAPAEVFRYDYKARPLRFYLDLAQFRGDDAKTRTELYYGFRGTDLGFVDTGSSLKSTLRCDLVVKDTTYEVLSRKEWSTIVQIPKDVQVQSQMPVNQGLFETAPGRYFVALRIRNPEADALGIYNLTLDVRGYSRDSLQVSDLQFCYDIQKTTQRDRFVKHNLRVVPYPFGRVDRGRPIFAYFEVYRLALDEAGESAYSIDYEVTVIKQRRGFFSRIFGAIGRLFAGGGKKSVTARVERKGHDSTAIEYISLDLSRLPVGTSRLTVRIHDQNSGATTQVSRIFELVG